MAEKINGRVAYADLLRTFATVAVIVLHLAGSQMANVAVGSQAWQVFNVYNSLVRWCVPVFVMLSGMFLLDSKHPLPLGKLFFHNCLRILLCLMFWGAVYALVDHWLAGAFSWKGLWQAMCSALRGNTHYHLWFCYMILGLYLITPCLRPLVKGASRAELHYFLLLCFLFASLLPTAFQLWPNATAALHTWYDRMGVKLVLGYVGYYVAGYYLREYTIGRIAEAVLYVLGALGAAATIWGTRWLSLQYGRLNQTFYDYFAPNVVCFAVAVVVLFRYVLGVSEERSRRQRLGHVARISFGIYLVHDLFILLLRSIGLTTLTFAPVASVPVLSAVVFLLSFALAWLINHIPFIGRWLT